MRWERLFDDLETQLAAEDRRELDLEVADRTRRERALLGLHERLAAAVNGDTLSLRVVGVGVLVGRVTAVGADWLLVEERPELPALVPFAALRAVTGLRGAQQTGAVAKAFALGAALRAVSRDRAVVDIVDLEGTVVTGTIDAVGLDSLDVAEHASDLPRRPEHVIATRTIPSCAIAVVRRR
jgi:hypothetical protein